MLTFFVVCVESVNNHRLITAGSSLGGAGVLNCKSWWYFTETCSRTRDSKANRAKDQLEPGQLRQG